MACTGAADARCGEAAIGQRFKVEQPPRALAARPMSPRVWNGSARSMARTLTPRHREISYVGSDSMLRHAGRSKASNQRPAPRASQRNEMRCELLRGSTAGMTGL